ncbi:MAG: hypothetical protein KGV59_03405 [Tenacibaculum sp.]|nr:hypothetical protein [Tenacibaculum sp.]
MLKFIISLGLCFTFINGFSQKNTSKSEKVKDSITYKTNYGLRLGIDISKIAISTFNKNYKGLEIVGDYRILKNWYIATELGYESEETNEYYTSSTSKGSYIRLGANYNVYKNWLDMNNEVYVGGRYGFALFEQTLNSYIPNTSSTYFPSKTNTNTIKEIGLKAHWLEFQIGIKVETLKNLFIGISGSYKVGINIQDQNNFKTLYSPGFNKVFKSKTGFGFNYTISYLIPFRKK